MPDVDDDIQTGSAVRRNRVVQSRVEHRNEWRELVATFTGTETHPRAVPLRCDLSDEHVDAKIHPWPVERVLYDGHDARLPRSRGAVENHDLTWLRHIGDGYHERSEHLHWGVAKR